jgi:hypothetical protein
MIWHSSRAFVTVFLSICLPLAAQAGTLQLQGIADGSSKYIEEYSDGYFQVDLYDPPPRETQQRFHALSNPAVTFGNTAFDGFLTDANWTLGSLTFDETGLLGGTGTAAITGLVLGIDRPEFQNYNRWRSLTAPNTPPVNTVLNFFGTVDLVGGVVTNVNLTSTLQIQSATTFPFGSFTATGLFMINGNRFDGYIVSPDEHPASPGDQRYIYDFSGTLSTVAIPEPGTWAMLLSAGGSLIWLRRRANTV